VIRALLLVVALLAAGCGVRPSDVVLGGRAPTVALAITVFLVSDGQVIRVLRPNPTSPDPLAVLAAGPTAIEREQGYGSEVPAGVVLEAAGASVRVSVDVTTLSEVAVDQIVCTAAQETVTLVGGGTGRGPLTCPVG
jgi:hypothetical protein